MTRYIADSYLYRAVGADIDGACGKCIQSLSDCMCHSLSRMDICEIIDNAPTADVVEKERYDRLLEKERHDRLFENANILADAVNRLLENANILAEELRKYQNADVPEKNVGKWVPVTERLPEKDGMYLVSISPSSRLEKRIDTDFYSHFGVWQIFGKFVTAWMPLPEPNRKETEDADMREESDNG